jgi:hypothetical protein
VTKIGETSMRRLLSIVVTLLSGILLLSSCSFIEALAFNEGAAAKHSLEQMTRIVDALNAQDAASIKGMFTDEARTDYSAEIDHGLEYLLSLFPDGDVTWNEEDGGSHPSYSYDGGRMRVRLISSYLVMSGGTEYEVFFHEIAFNQIEPGVVGLTGLSAVASTESGDSPLEVARTSWAGSDRPPGVFIGDDGALSRDRAKAIVDALNRQDAAAMKSMFTEFARAEHSTELDEGLAYLLSLFPNGDVVWQEGHGASAITERILDEGRTVLRSSFDTVMSGGVAYRLFFAEFTQNELDPDNVGIYAIGAVPQQEFMFEVPEADLQHWARTFEVNANAHPGIFVSDEVLADERMSQIAAALTAGDPAALRSLFSVYAVAQSPHLDDGLDYVLGLIGGKDLTYELHDIYSFEDQESGRMTQFVSATFVVSVGGNDYRLFFSDFTANEVRNPDNIGLYALGVEPWAPDPESRCTDTDFGSWTCHMTVDGSTGDSYAGIYVP